MKIKMMRKVFFILCSLVLLPLLANAQFNSGSTGADGALDLSIMSCTTCDIQLPESGVLNYTTVNIPSGKTLRFKRNSRNTPVTMLTQGNVTINGGIELNAGLYPCSTGMCFDRRVSGPGGFNGGDSGRPGFGPGGGIVSSDPNLQHGKWIGPLSLVPIVGGSGASNGGNGGGGAIVIAASTSINISGGGIYALGSITNYNDRCGSGGAIRLVSNSISLTSGTLNATGCNSSNGVIRVEATQLDIRGSTSPAATLSPINPTVTSSNSPQLTITSVGGYSVPSYAGSRFDTVDLLLPNQLTDPINVVIQAVNIPSGTQVQVGFASGSSSATSISCTLSGGPGPLSCTATISNLNRTGVTYLLATAVFSPSGSAQNYNPKGENQVAKIKLEAVLGAKPKYIFLNDQGKEIDNTNLSKNFLQFFGM